MTEDEDRIRRMKTGALGSMPSGDCLGLGG